MDARGLAVLIYLVSALTALAMLFFTQQTVGIFQLESYKRPQLFLRLREERELRRAPARRMYLLIAGQAALLVALLAVIGVLTGGAAAAQNLELLQSIGAYGAALAYPLSVFLLAAALIVFFRWRRQPSKKPLKYTARVLRLNAALLLVLFLAQIAVFVAFSVLFAYIEVFFLTSGMQNRLGVPMTMALYMVTMASMPGLAVLAFELVAGRLLPSFLALASLLVQPIENAVKSWYFNDARKKLAGFPDMVKIGITGSYGKTSAKVILATILGEKYKTLATPSSYNTPMGVTRVIREQLDGSYRVFIAEMGARHVGDIAEMCRLVAPKYGLLTSVGPQHLETFLTIDNVAKTKYELVEALPQDGMAFFPADNDICVQLYEKTEKPKALFGIEGEGLYMAARNVAHGPQGGSFMLVGPDGEAVPCNTRLLGRHNIQNILGCAAVAYAMGLTLQEIARGIAKAEPVEHRLQLLPTANGLTVIDDAFNSNPAGARAALEVLRSFPGRKIIITPGLVELGGAEEAENEAFGRAMAGAVDVAILVARNGAAMKRGLVAEGYDEGNIICVGSLSAATAALGALSRVGDVVLFENDLPDQYEQK